MAATGRHECIANIDHLDCIGVFIQPQSTAEIGPGGAMPGAQGLVSHGHAVERKILDIRPAQRSRSQYTLEQVIAVTNFVLGISGYCAPGFTFEQRLRIFYHPSCNTTHRVTWEPLAIKEDGTPASLTDPVVWNFDCAARVVNPEDGTQISPRSKRYLGPEGSVSLCSGPGAGSQQRCRLGFSGSFRQRDGRQQLCCAWLLVPPSDPSAELDSSSLWHQCACDRCASSEQPGPWCLRTSRR